MIFNLFLVTVNNYYSNLLMNLMQSHSISFIDALNFMVDMQYLS